MSDDLLRVNKALATAGQRLQYAGDLWHDQGNMTRAQADWAAAQECYDAIDLVSSVIHPAIGYIAVPRDELEVLAKQKEDRIFGIGQRVPVYAEWAMQKLRIADHTKRSAKP